MQRALELLCKLRDGRIGTADIAKLHMSNVDTSRHVFGAALILAGVRQEVADAIAAQICKTCNVCTVDNVQLCKEQFMHYILPLQGAWVGFCYYLETLCSSFSAGTLEVKGHQGLDECFGLASNDMMPVSHVKRLHVLYILNDVLASVWAKTDRSMGPQSDSSDAAKVEREHAHEAMRTLRTCFKNIFDLAACGDADEAGKPKEALDELIASWDSHWFWDAEEVAELQRLSDRSVNRTRDLTMDVDTFAKYFALPTRTISHVLDDKHGVKDDPDAPWHLLPAANGMKLREERGYPLIARALPRGGYLLTNAGKPPSQEVRKEAEGLLCEMKHCFDAFTNAEQVQDIDALGNKIWKDPERPTRNYWGFTEEGLQKMKENKKRFNYLARGYDDIPPPERPRYVRNSEVDRARELATLRGRGGRGGPRGGRGGYRGRGAF